MAAQRSGLKDWAQNAAARAILGLALVLPYRVRVPVMGWVVSRVVAPLAGWNARIRRNLDYAWPDFPDNDRRKLVRDVADNVGRTLIEIYSGRAFLDHIKDTPIEGPGLAALEATRGTDRPVILATAHFGNYDVVRGKLSRDGFPMAALYRPMANPAFHKHYLAAISAIAEPVFAADGRGLMAFLRHLKAGGVAGILCDIALTRAPDLSYFGKPAHTALSAAEWTLKCDGLLIPVFGIREPDGMSFRIHVSEPIEHSTPEAMMQAYNDEVERMTRAHPEQWFWIHKRWKLGAGVASALSAAELPPK